MTARPPVETLEASSEGSSESLETGDENAAAAGETGGSEAKLERSEPSMSRTLEAILSKSDADDDLSVPPEGDTGSVGTKTLLGLGASGLPLPPRAPARPAKLSDDEHSFSVEDVFDDEGTAVSSVQANGKGRSLKGSDDQVGDLLDEVAEALNVQAATQASTVDSTVGALPGMPVPPARPIRTDVAARRGGDDGEEFEFEDPDDGPTTLNAHGEANSEDVDIGTDDDDEAVVLGPAKLPAARPASVTSRLPAPAAVAAGPTGVKRATPFAGLPVATLPSFPAPASGRSRLPTPGPAQALGLPPPGRTGPPGGTPVNGVPEVPGQADSGRRSSSGRAVAGSEKSAGHHATAAVMESLSSAVESAAVVLKKDVKFRVASLGGVVLGTFVVGLLIGRAVIGSGKKPTAVASEVAPAADEPKAAPPAAPRAPAVVAPAAPVAPPVAAAPVTPPPPPAAQALPPVEPVVAEAPALAPVHKRRARRANPVVAKEDKESLPKVSSGKSSGPAPKVASKVAPAAPSGGKKKSTWHDPFAD